MAGIVGNASAEFDPGEARAPRWHPCARRPCPTRRPCRPENIGATVYYPLIYRYPFYRERFSVTPGLCAATELVEARLVVLPLFLGITDADQGDVLRALDKVFARYPR